MARVRLAGPKWTKMGIFRPKWTILVHFGLANAKIQFGIRSFWPKWSSGPFWTILVQYTCRQYRGHSLISADVLVKNFGQAPWNVGKQEFGCGHPWPERTDVHDSRGCKKTLGRETSGWFFIIYHCVVTQMALTGQRIAMVDMPLLVFPAFPYLP